MCARGARQDSADPKTGAHQDSPLDAARAGDVQSDMRAAGVVATARPARWGALAPRSRSGTTPQPVARRGFRIPGRALGRARVTTRAALGAESATVVVASSAIEDAFASGPVSAAASSAAASAASTASLTPSAASETLRVLSAAILDQHSVWWALASPLFALSVGPYLLFLRNIWRAPSATDEMRASFATLLLFVVVSIPAEAYTQEAYGTVLSNIDALHFLIQAAISLTNLRIMLAFRDGCRDGSRANREGISPNADPVSSPSAPSSSSPLGWDGEGWDGEGWDGRLNSARGGPLASLDWGGGGDGGGPGPGALDVARESAEKFRPGRLVEAAAGLALVSTFALMALDSRLVSLDDLGVGGGVLGATSDAFLATFRSAAVAAADALAPGLPAGPPNALSVPTWGVHVFSLVEWLVAMGLVWEYAEVTGNRGWRTLTWGMLPLHASGVCACAQHFFFNAADLEWLVTAQGALTMAGNAGMCYAAGRIADADRNTEETSDRGDASSPTDARENAAGAWYEFDVEGFAPMWSEDDDGTFAAKIAALSLAVATVVRAASLSAGPAFGDGGEAAWARGWVAAAMVSVPFALNVAKWRFRQAGVEAAELAVAGGGGGVTMPVKVEEEQGVKEEREEEEREVEVAAGRGR